MVSTFTSQVKKDLWESIYYRDLSNSFLRQIRYPSNSSFFWREDIRCFWESLLFSSSLTWNYDASFFSLLFEASTFSMDLPSLDFKILD